MATPPAPSDQHSSSPSSSSSRSSPVLIPAPPLASSRYNRQLLVPQLGLQGQTHLQGARVLIIGLGGLGSPAALYLAGAGVGTLGLLDSDTVETTNLHRQIAHTEQAARAAQSKVASAIAACRALNSQVEYVAHVQRAEPSTLLAVLARGRYQLVLDCTDNPATRYLISDACVLAGCVLVSGAAQRGEGQVVVLNSPPVAVGVVEKGPCHRCVFPRPPPPDMVRGCSEIGILGHVVGVIGTLMAGEAVKTIAQGKHLLSLASASANLAGEKGAKGIVDSTSATSTSQVNGTSPAPATKQPPHTMLLYNTFAADPRQQFRTITLRGRRKDCLACGDDEALAAKNITRITADAIVEGRWDYTAFCGVIEDVKVLGDERRVGADEFLRLRRGSGGRARNHNSLEREQRNKKRKKNLPLVVDVREEHEVELGAKVRGSVNIPISRILRHGGKAFDELHCYVRGDEGELDESSGEDFGEGRQGGLVDRENHFAVPTSQNGSIGDQESHNSLASAGNGTRQGGVIDEEKHIPIQNSPSQAHQPFPQPFNSRLPEPLEETISDSKINDDDSGVPVYFICQRGNDSQIAAQMLLEKLRREPDETQKKQWGWIGDVRGGFVAMERHEFGE